VAARQVRDHEGESALRTWLLRREHSDASDAVGLAAPALDAMFALAESLFEPLALDAEIGWLELETFSFHGHARPMEWRLARRQQPPGRETDTWPVADSLVKVDRLDRRAADRFVARACAQEPPAGSIACPAILAFTAVRARLFEPVAGDRLVLLRKEGPGSLVIERDGGRAWVAAPGDGFITAPVEVHAKLTRELLEIHVEAHWSPWSEEDRPGTLAVEVAVGRLVASGWELDE
jgi:hypothetical protein